MFSHVMLGSNNIERSRIFYDALFTSIHAKVGRIDGRGRLIYAHRGALFIITQPIDGQPATPANGGTIGFLLDHPVEVQAWHAAGIGAGGAAIEDPPGHRHSPTFGDLYLAYLRDPDGNKLCGLYRPNSPD